MRREEGEVEGRVEMERERERKEKLETHEKNVKNERKKKLKKHEFKNGRCRSTSRSRRTSQSAPRERGDEGASDACLAGGGLSLVEEGE